MQNISNFKELTKMLHEIKVKYNITLKQISVGAGISASSLGKIYYKNTFKAYNPKIRPGTKDRIIKFINKINTHGLEESIKDTGSVYVRAESFRDELNDIRLNDRARYNKGLF